jgi:hypothetical protein
MGVGAGVVPGVGVRVGAGVGVGVTTGAAGVSKAPMSHVLFRCCPRWSTPLSAAGQLPPAPMAGLPGWSASVGVGPPLPCSGPSRGSGPTTSPLMAAPLSAPVRVESMVVLITTTFALLPLAQI